MGLIRYYLRVFFRSHFKPISQPTAKKWEINSSVIYFITAWSALGYSFYAFMKIKEKGGEIGSAQVFDPYAYMKKIGRKEEFTIYTFSGTKMNKEVLHYDELDKRSAAVSET